MTTGKATYKNYRCCNCGHEHSIQTNHWGVVMNHCSNCSWKATWGENPGCIMFGTWHRPHECTESEPEQVHFAQLATDKKAICGAVLLDEEEKSNGVRATAVYADVTCYHCRLGMADSLLIRREEI